MAIHPKVTSTAFVSALSLVLVSELRRRGITIAPEEASAITMLLGTLAGYLTGSGDVPAPAAPPQPAPPPA